MTGFCKDCKHWDGSVTGWGQCLQVHRVLSSKAYVVCTDSENHLTALVTASDFGCVQFEAKGGS